MAKEAITLAELLRSVLTSDYAATHGAEAALGSSLLMSDGLPVVDSLCGERRIKVGKCRVTVATVMLSDSKDYKDRMEQEEAEALPNVANTPKTPLSGEAANIQTVPMPASALVGPLVGPDVASLNAREDDSFDEGQRRHDEEEAPKNVCPNCDENFATHNDDGSCVADEEKLAGTTGQQDRDDFFVSVNTVEGTEVNVASSQYGDDSQQVCLLQISALENYHVAYLNDEQVKQLATALTDYLKAVPA